MLGNDEIFWTPTDEMNAAQLSWSTSGGDVSALRVQTHRRWRYCLQLLAQADVPAPSGKVVEFGAGMGFLDDLLDDRCSTIVMLDHTDAFIEQRPRPLSSRCRHVLWSQESLDALQAEDADYDWLLLFAVLYHVDDATAAALIRELGMVLRPGGHVLIEGWDQATPQLLRKMATKSRLFSPYPCYPLNVDLLSATLAPEYQELWRDGILVYRKLPTT